MVLEIVISWHAILSYVVLCCITFMPCCVMSQYGAAYHVVLCCVVMSCYVVLCHVVFCYVSYYVIYYATLCYVLLHHVISGCAMSCYIITMFYFVIVCYFFSVIRYP